MSYYDTLPDDLLEDDILASISQYGTRLARRQICNECLTDKFEVSQRGQEVLAVFDRIVQERGW